MILLIVLLILAALSACLLGGLYFIAFHSPHRGQNDPLNIPSSEQYQAGRDGMVALIESFEKIPYERVSIRNREGMALSARYYHRQDGAPLAICLHGYRGTAVRDFCGGIHAAFDMNQNALVVDERSCGLSEGHAITFGVKERTDCLDWIEYARNRFGADVKIFLYGVSMGAATVLMVSGMNPPNVCGVVADSPYSSPEAIIRKVCRDMKLPPAPLMPLIGLSARLFAGFSMKSASAAESVRSAKVPVLIIHGEDDRFVPCEMSREIHAANPGRVELHTFPGAGHGLSYIVDRERYEGLVRAFFARINAGETEETP